MALYSYFVLNVVHSLQFMTAHIFAELYLPSKILSACLTVIGALHQLILCDSDNTAQAFDDLVYIFTRVCALRLTMV